MSGLYKALGGSQPSAEQQPSAPVPPASAGAGTGSPQLDSLFTALQAQAKPQGTQPLELGPQQASANDVQAGMRNAFGYTPPVVAPPTTIQAQQPAPAQAGTSTPSLATTATNFFNKMKN